VAGADAWIWEHRAAIDFAVCAFIYGAGVFALWSIIHTLKGTNRDT